MAQPYCCQAGSGLSIAAYCRHHGLREHGFYWWRRELARRDAQQLAAFVPVTVAEERPMPMVPASASQVEIVLPGERRIRVADGGASRWHGTACTAIMAALLAEHRIHVWGRSICEGES